MALWILEFGGGSYGRRSPQHHKTNGADCYSVKSSSLFRVVGRGFRPNVLFLCIPLEYNIDVETVSCEYTEAGVLG